MVHGPCGNANPKCSCMVDNKCTKRYRKEFNLITELGDDDYPTYRLRSPEQGGHTAEVYRNPNTSGKAGAQIPQLPLGDDSSPWGR
jgi:hypothetical protein